jgi:hypothetical protein
VRSKSSRRRHTPASHGGAGVSGVLRGMTAAASAMRQAIPLVRQVGRTLRQVRRDVMEPNSPARLTPDNRVYP